jgi:RecJ-like exonuclease
MTVSDGGKGSARRKEDSQAVRDGWDRIFGKKEPMIDDEHEDYTNDDIDDSMDEDCSWCGGCGEGDYDGASCRRCHGTGVEPREKDCDDHDFID